MRAVLSLPYGMMVSATVRAAPAPWLDGRRDTDMRDWGGAHTMRHLPLAEMLGLAMARRAADILDRHRRELDKATRAGAADAAVPAADAARFAADDAIFTAVLDAANDCIGRFDTRTPEERWCDALVHLLLLARLPAGDDSSGIHGGWPL